MKRSARLAVILVGLFCLVGAIHAAGGNAMGYQTPSELNAAMETIAKDNKDIATLHTIGQSYGGTDIVLLELGKDKTAPAIMVVANMEGNYPPGSEAAALLAGHLTDDWADALENHRWFIVPVGNPDGYARFFDAPLVVNMCNRRPVNGDGDDAIDEDGPDDLNGDGYITTMRQVHPAGRWLEIEDNPVLMKEADKEKGEIGKYRLYPEGIDNDGDGNINEDGPGGTNPGRNFPHAFRHYTKTNGLWAASEPESRAILEFAFDHPEIAMMLVFGRSNTLLNVPEGGKKASATQDKYKLPRWMAREVGVDPETEFTIDVLLEMGKEFTGNPNLTEDMVLQFLDVGAAVNPNRNDVTYWSGISKKYNEFLEENELDAKRLSPQDFPSGSIDEWGYYQFGVPTFSVDFWTLPEAEEKEDTTKKVEGVLTPDEVEGMTNEEFIALGSEKISAFLKASDSPANITADMVIMGLKGGMMTTKKMAEMMRQMKKKEEAGGADETEEALYSYNPDAFIAWQPYDHPTLGPVEIGGMIPYSTVAPSRDSVVPAIEQQLPFLKQLAGMLPNITIDTVMIDKVSAGVWKVEAWIVNQGFLPYPTHQGKRCQRPVPTVATLSGKSLTFLEGRARRVLGLIGGSGGTEKAHWLVNALDGSTLTLEVGGPATGSVSRDVVLKGGAK